MAVKVQLRGGTSEEHKTFVGRSREVTVDTTTRTLVVHDGRTPGGNPLATEKSVKNIVKDYFQSEVNYDDRYSKLDHKHTEYLEKVGDSKLLTTILRDGYEGMASKNGTDEHNYIRTPRGGILPYQAGGASNLGSVYWRFNCAYLLYSDAITTITEELRVKSKSIVFGDTTPYNTISFNGNNTSGEYSFKYMGDNKAGIDVAYVSIGGKRIYIGSSFPTDARVNDILIQV